ncbi:MAG: orotidine-5'-phosphate decarboxylase [Oscillospiraceae bacterium]|nr:orotidine-5'-phosphate decarboxylase [Oscillospiraceae bacterium]
MDRLIEKIVEKNNPTVVGLDPNLDFIPESIKRKHFEEDGCTLNAVAKSIFEFNKKIIDAVEDIVPAVKPQMAYYEMFGHHGILAFEKTVKYAQLKGLYVIADGKRNDIGSTMTAYATAFLGKIKISDIAAEVFGTDALTVNGYLGTDCINPLLKTCVEFNKSIFVLVKTSNPSSGELQDRLMGKTSLYEIMGDYCEVWGKETIGEYGYSKVGAVVGATYPEQLTTLRQRLPHTFFLVPGYGAQGGAADSVKGAFDKDGLGAIVNSSRGIMCAYTAQNRPAEDFEECARTEAINMRNALNKAIGRL